MKNSGHMLQDFSAEFRRCESTSAYILHTHTHRYLAYYIEFKVAEKLRYKS